MYSEQQPNWNLKNPSSFIHTLPKANQIFEVLQHVKKSIYPFEMKTNMHKFVEGGTEPYWKEMGNKNGGPIEKFRPEFQSVEQYFQSKWVIYDKFNNVKDQELFNQNIYPLHKLKNLKNIDYMAQIDYIQQLSLKDGNLLQFNSRFQSGNLSLVSHRNGTYYLLLHNDVNTSGYTSWFYFHVRAPKKGRYRFVILNYGKAGAMHAQGVKICVHGGGQGQGWRRAGERIWCEGNRGLFGKGKFLGFCSLGFQYEFQGDGSEVYFSYNVPYTYNDLCCFLDSIQQKKHPFFNRKLAGISLAGNRLQALTVTNFSLLAQGHDLPVIIIMARSHPGETVSSWITHRFIQFIISEEADAVNLRDNFVWKIFPMVNPDGVIHGNYRCSLSGRDLNRRWNQTNKELFPQVYFIRNQIIKISRRKTIKMILDLHGHTKKRKIFAYGCNNKAQPHRCRLFPYILSKLSPYFQFKYCNFCLSKYKYGTARISLYNELKIPYIYTIECSQFGTMDGHLNLEVFGSIAYSLGKGCLILFRIKDMKIEKGLTVTGENYDNIESQLLNDTGLIKIGSEKDSGSESEPSVDNIKYQKLNQMNQRRQFMRNRVNTQNDGSRRSACGERMKSSINASQSLQKMRKSTPVRPKTSEINTQKYLQPEKKCNPFLQKRLQYTTRPNPRIQSTPKSQPPCPSTSTITKPMPQRRRAEALNFINLSLSIFDETRSNRSYYRTGASVGTGMTGTGARGSKIDSYVDFNESLLNKLKMGTRNYIQFRRIQ